MRTASWDELDKDATYYGWHNPHNGATRPCIYTLGEAWCFARDAGLVKGITVAFIDGEIVRVPDGDPPAKPSLTELQRAADEAEIVMLGDFSAVSAQTRAYTTARTAFLRARLAEGEK